MAVIKKKTSEPKLEKTQIELNDGLIVNLTIQHGEYQVGQQEALIEAQGDFNIIQGRMTHLRKMAIEAETDRESTRYRNQFQSYVKKQDDLLHAVDTAIITIVPSWDVALSEEDEKAGKFVPLTYEGLKQLEPALRLDIFTKIGDKMSKYTEAEKKASSVNSNGDSPTQKELPVPSLSSMQESNLHSFTDSDPMQSSDGALTSSTKPS